MSLSVGIINYFTGAILTFRILYIMFNLFELLSIKYTMFPYGVQIMLSHFEISPIGVYTYYLFFELFLYIIFIVWHYESYHLYCVVRAIFSPCLAMYMYMYIWPRNTSSLSVTHRPFVSVTLVASKLTQDTYQTG